MLAFKDLHQTRENLWAHAVYPSDRQTNRVSWAFAVRPPAAEPADGEPRVAPDTDTPLAAMAEQAATEPIVTEPVGEELNALPHVTPDPNTPFAAVTERVCTLLGAPRGRLLVNIQQYFDASVPIAPHHDGEVFKRSFDGAIEEALYPHKVALLCTTFNAVGGGTRLHFPDGHESVVECRPGDLLVFDNVNLLHSVDRFHAPGPLEDEAAPDQPLGEPPLVRCIVGWRSLEDQTVLFEQKRAAGAGGGTDLGGGPAPPATQEAASDPCHFRPVSFVDACARHARFLNGGEWDARRSDLDLLGLLDA